MPQITRLFAPFFGCVFGFSAATVETRDFLCSLLLLSISSRNRRETPLLNLIWPGYTEFSKSWLGSNALCRDFLWQKIVNKALGLGKCGPCRNIVSTFYL